MSIRVPGQQRVHRRHHPERVGDTSGSARIGGTPFPPSNGAEGNGIVSPCAGSHPSPGVYVCNDGTTLLTWGQPSDTPLNTLGPDQQFSLQFTTTVDTHYLHDDPSGGHVVTGDTFRNSARLTYDASSITGLSPPNAVTHGGGGSVDSTRSASQSVPVPGGVTKSVIAVTRGDGWCSR